MKQINSLMAALFVMLSPITFAEVLEVYSWKALPGKGSDLIQNMVEAAGIHTELGAVINIYQRDVGSTYQGFDYVMRWDDPISWATSRENAAKSPELVRFFQKVSRRPSGELVNSLEGINLNPATSANSFGDINVFRVYVWDPAPGKTQQLLENFATAEKIHESLGARVESYAEGIGGTGNYHYTMGFENWAALADFFLKLAVSEEWAAFQASTNDEDATLISSSQASALNSN